MAQLDLLRDVLELAARERALEGEALVAFATALRDRAQIVLAERVQPLEERIRSLEAHRRAVEGENAWRREAMEGLEERVRGLEAENGWRREAMAGLEASVRALTLERTTLAADHDKATRAHQQLVAHHQDVVRQVIVEAQAVGALPWIQVREARRRLAAMADRLRPEAP